MTDSVPNPNFDPKVGESSVDPKAGDLRGTPIDAQWSEADFDQLQAALSSESSDFDLDLDVSELEAPKPSKPKKAKPAPVASAEEAPAEVEEESAEPSDLSPVPDEVPVEEVEGEEAPAEEVEETEAEAFEFTGADGNKINLTRDQVQALVSHTEQALINEQSAIAAANEARASAEQAQTILNQLGGYVQAGNGQAILQLLGLPAQGSAVPNDTAPAPDLFNNVDWTDPDSIRNAFSASLQHQQRHFESLLNREREQRAAQEQQAQQQVQHQRVVQWGNSVDAVADRMATEHPMASRLTPKQRAALQRDVREGVVRAFNARRITTQMQPQQIAAVVKQIVDAEASSWAADGRQASGQLVRKVAEKGKKLPKVTAPRVSATTLPQQKSAPMDGLGSSDDWNRSIMAEARALMARSNVEG